ncbi:MAG: hypothetical protein ACFFCS_27605, partial [Candidatus Hodarchaeota archaeon]
MTKKKTPRQQVSKDFLMYCKNIPLMLLGVDIENKLVYWVYIDRKFVDGIGDFNGESRIVEYPTRNLINQENTSGYLEQWRRLARIDMVLRHNFQVLEAENEKLKKFIEDNSIPDLGEMNINNQIIHEFLDHLNYHLDGNFKILKELFFQNCWKVGFAYDIFQSDRLSYSLYPIPFQVNDTQIRQIKCEENKLDKRARNMFEKIKNARRFTFIDGNPLERNPKKYALQLI